MRRPLRRRTARRTRPMWRRRSSRRLRARSTTRRSRASPEVGAATAWWASSATPRLERRTASTPARAPAARSATPSRPT
eukprot:5778742-Heterocapsa_arctica.AAC.1